jgi:FkbM family methyltransferase
MPRKPLRLPGFARRLFDPFAERLPVPILGGVNRGRWWSLASAGHGHVTGTRTATQLSLIHALVGPGDVVWDIGAHHGYVTLCAAARAGDTGQIHAFEPFSRSRRILQRHVRWNRMSRVGVHAHALSSFEGESSLGGGFTSKTHSLGQGTERVSVRTGASLIATGECKVPSFLKVDVEGEEGAVIEGLGRALPLDSRLLIAVHSAATDRKCTDLLTPLGFQLLPSPRLSECRSGNWHSDPDLLCLGPAYAAREEVHEMVEGIADW